MQLFICYWQAEFKDVHFDRDVSCPHSAGNNFSLFTGHNIMSFQIFILVGHLKIGPDIIY